MRKTIGLLLLGAVVATSGCGYFMAGSWDNDPKNWKRAFGAVKPDDVTVVNSHYWRSAHWSYEFAYFFEIAANSKLREQLRGDKDLRRFKVEESVSVKNDFFSKTPSWFAPKPPEQYEIWAYRDGPSRFRALIDQQTGTIFFTDFQL